MKRVFLLNPQAGSRLEVSYGATIYSGVSISVDGEVIGTLGTLRDLGVGFEHLLPDQSTVRVEYWRFGLRPIHAWRNGLELQDDPARQTALAKRVLGVCAGLMLLICLFVVLSWKEHREIDELEGIQNNAATATLQSSWIESLVWGAIFAGCLILTRPRPKLAFGVSIVVGMALAGLGVLALGQLVTAASQAPLAAPGLNQQQAFAAGLLTGLLLRGALCIPLGCVIAFYSYQALRGAAYADKLAHPNPDAT